MDSNASPVRNDEAHSARLSIRGKGGQHLKRRAVRFEPATEEQVREWKEGKRPLWRFERMWPEGHWETQGMCDRVEVN